jgi:hypothetical protein
MGREERGTLGGKRESRKDGGWKRGPQEAALPHTKLCALSLVQAAAYLRALSFHALPKLRSRCTAGYSNGCGGIDSKTRERERNKASYVRLKKKRGGYGIKYCSRSRTWGQSFALSRHLQHPYGYSRGTAAAPKMANNLEICTRSVVGVRADLTML